MTFPFTDVEGSTRSPLDQGGRRDLRRGEGGFDGREHESAMVAEAIAAATEAKFLTNLGQIESAAPLAEAMEVLQSGDDTLAYLITLEALCEIESYLGDTPDRLIELTKEARGAAEE